MNKKTRTFEHYAAISCGNGTAHVYLMKNSPSAVRIKEGLSPPAKSYGKENISVATQTSPEQSRHKTSSANKSNTPSRKQNSWN